MKRLKFLFVTFLLVFASTVINNANASNSINANEVKETKIVKIRLKEKPNIQIIYFWETCPDGTIQCVGNVGYTDSGSLIGVMYWGVAVACANHQSVIFA